jgi:hypothetical protein
MGNQTTCRLLMCLCTPDGTGTCLLDNLPMGVHSIMFVAHVGHLRCCASRCASSPRVGCNENLRKKYFCLSSAHARGVPPTRSYMAAATCEGGGAQWRGEHRHAGPDHGSRLLPNCQNRHPLAEATACGQEVTLLVEQRTQVQSDQRISTSGMCSAQVIWRQVIHPCVRALSCCPGCESGMSQAQSYAGLHVGGGCLVRRPMV